MAVSVREREWAFFTALYNLPELFDSVEDVVHVQSDINFKAVRPLDSADSPVRFAYFVFAQLFAMHSPGTSPSIPALHRIAQRLLEDIASNLVHRRSQLDLPVCEGLTLVRETSALQCTRVFVNAVLSYHRARAGILAETVALGNLRLRAVENMIELSLRGDEENKLLEEV